MDFSKMSDQQLEIVGKVIKAAEANGINPDFVLPMVQAESNFNPLAKSSKGAFGVMQLMPATAKSLKVDPQIIDENIDGGMKLLKELISNPNIGNDPVKIIAAYNAHPKIKFLQTGDIKDLPQETLTHLSRIAEYSGGAIVPSATIEQPSEQTSTVTNQVGENANNQSQSREIEVSAEDYIREKAKALGQLIEDNPVQAAQLGASGLGAVAGAALNPALKGAVRYTQEASQRPAFARPGVAPASPTPAVAPAAGQSVMRQPIPSGGPDGGRLPTGQTGTMPYNYAKAAGLTDIEAARALDMTKQTGGVHDLTSQRREALNRIQSSFPSETYVENPRYSGIMTPGQGVGGGPRESISFKPAVPPSPDLPQGQPGGPSQLPPRQPISTVPKGMSPLANATETIKSVGRLGANMVGDLLRSKAMGALGGGMAVYEGLEALKQLRAGNEKEAALSGIGALGGITSMIPTIPTAIIGGGLSAIPSLYRAYKSATPEQVQRMQTNVDAAGNPLQ